MIKNFNEFVNEALESTDEEYYEYILKHYSEDLLKTIKKGEEMAMSMTNAKITTMKSDSENLIVRWIDSDPVIILGAVTITGKLNRGDILDLKIWINECIEKIEEGKTIITSPNQLSTPLIEKIIRLCEQKGIELYVDIQDTPIEESGIKWKNYIIRKK